MLKVLDFSTQCVSLLHSSNIALQFFPDVRISDGLLISWIRPPNPTARLLEAKIEMKIIRYSPVIFSPVKFARVRYDTGTSSRFHVIFSDSLGLNIKVGKTLLQVFPGLFVTSQLNTDFFKIDFLNQKYFTPSRILRHRR